MTTHLKYALAGPPQRHLRDGGDVLVYSTNTPLGEDEEFSTPVRQVLNSFTDDDPAPEDKIARGNGNQLIIDLLADQDSAADGVIVEEYDENGNLLGTTLEETLTADTPMHETVNLTGHSFSFKFVNGSTAQESFRCRVVLRNS